jgi:predicted GIY-YIG superfamily endonuclease
VSAGYIYVLAFANGTVKVGRTRNVDQRLGAHKSDARKYGIAVTDQWMSPCHLEWFENEERLKKIAASLGGTARSKEYFGGVDFAAIVAEAQHLFFTPPPSTPDESASVAPTHSRSNENAPFRSMRLGTLAERERTAELEARYEEMTYEGLRLLRKVPFKPEDLRAAGADRTSPDAVVLTDLADLMEAQMSYEAVMNRFIDRAHLT